MIFRYFVRNSAPYFDVIHSIQASHKLLTVHASEGRWSLVEPYPRFDIMNKRRSNDGKKKNGIILKESSASQRKRINGEVLTLHQASRSPILSIPKI